MAPIQVIPDYFIHNIQIRSCQKAYLIYENPLTNRPGEFKSNQAFRILPANRNVHPRRYVRTFTKSSGIKLNFAGPFNFNKSTWRNLRRSLTGVLARRLAYIYSSFLNFLTCQPFEVVPATA
ncbi:tyrosyl-DNA Phosphodiesterase (Tdp1) [Corchorus olitorius]|uniref:Tyrosyl-DNA Phosphodiesterase (Tdp1) n=1 Tax=Corchorus olitorius TaxID=93759 RepID=A0A1R3H5A9_9ROSI|nr:tyrosyl-DNA Phosphodiesterase (Tdp1) [Corchorus olitorius]